MRSIFSALPSSLALPRRSTAARVVASDAGRVGGVGLAAAAAAAASGSFSGSGAGLWGPRRDGECGCSARVLRVGERLRDHGWPEPLRVVLEMLFLSVSCFSVSAGRLLGLGHAPGRRKELGHLGLGGLDRAG